MSPPDAVTLRFGDDSFLPHWPPPRHAALRLDVLHLPGIALDIDNPADLAHFSKLGTRTRAGLWLAANKLHLGAGEKATGVT
jgi:2-phospho-L-lactate guanylyltransferase